MEKQMTHPITPPTELIKEWMSEFYGCSITPGTWTLRFATRAAQWGADTELEACCDWMSECTVGCPNELRAVRRPKPPNLKEQALEALSEMEDDCLMVTHSATIRKALEALPDKC